MAHDLFRALPSVSRLLAHPKTEPLLIRFNREYVVQGCRDILDELRSALDDGHVDAATLEDDAILARLEARLAGSAEATLQRVVNATGTVLHTNLGRAILPQAAIDAVIQAASHPVNLEYDLAQGDRGQRELAVESLLMDLSGAEAATAVNNNAAAVLLALNTLAFGKEVIVSRGELIEIGGAFRIPDIMARSGAILKEVGTTNRTHVSDYENALTDRTALLLKVHTSNYRVVGFVAEVGLAELVAIGRRRGIPVMEDLGSGALVDLSRYDLPKEPVVAERIALGADLVTFSGDKVLGGPQAGVVVGRATLVKQMAANPLHRAYPMREAHNRGTRGHAPALPRIGVHRPRDSYSAGCSRGRSPTSKTSRSARFRHSHRRWGLDFACRCRDSTSQIGSGAYRLEEIPTKVIAIEHDFMGPHRMAGDPPGASADHRPRVG